MSSILKLFLISASMKKFSQKTSILTHGRHLVSYYLICLKGGNFKSQNLFNKEMKGFVNFKTIFPIWQGIISLFFLFPALCCKVWFLHRIIWKSKPNDKNLETKHSNAYYLISWDKKKVRLSTLSSWEQRLLVNKQPISIQDLPDCLPDNNKSEFCDNQSEFKKERLMEVCFIKQQK